MNTSKTLLLFILLVVLMSQKRQVPKPYTITKLFSKETEVQEYISKDINRQHYRVVTVIPFIKNTGGQNYTSFLLIAETYDTNF